MELKALIDLMVADTVFTQIVNNPLAQFGPRTRQYLGAQLLPEKRVPQNVFKEEYIQYRSNIANAGTRYSPPQLKGNQLIGSMTVELAESDIAAEFTAQDYDALIGIIQKLGNVTQLSQVPVEAMTSIMKWADTGINVPLLEWNEWARWRALVDASITLVGDNGFEETVNYSSPSGHRVNAGGDWSDDTYDPYPDIIAGYKKLKEKGYEVNRIVTSLDVLMTLLNNNKIMARLGLVNILAGVTTGMPGIASKEQLNNRLASDGLPGIETYDLQYRTQTGTEYFLDRDVFLMLGTTGQDIDIDFGDDKPFTLPNTLGYLAVGRPANRPAPGRAAVIEYNDGKGAPLKGQGWQTSLPVIANPEAVYVIGNITTE